MIVLIDRTLLSLRGRTPRALAALAVTAAVAGCGGGGSAPPVNSTTPAASANPTPGAPAAGASAGRPGERAVRELRGQRREAECAEAHQRCRSVAHAGVRGGQSGSRRPGDQRRLWRPGDQQLGRPQQPRHGDHDRHRAATTHDDPDQAGLHHDDPTSLPPRRPRASLRPRHDHARPAQRLRPGPSCERSSGRRTKTKTKTSQDDRSRPHRDQDGSSRCAIDRVPAVDASRACPDRASWSPGGNVGCQVTPGAVRCSVLQRVWAAPVQPADVQDATGATRSRCRAQRRQVRLRRQQRRLSQREGDPGSAGTTRSGRSPVRCGASASTASPTSTTASSSAGPDTRSTDGFGAAGPLTGSPAMRCQLKRVRAPRLRRRPRSVPARAPPPAPRRPSSRSGRSSLPGPPPAPHRRRRGCAPGRITSVSPAA